MKPIGKKTATIVSEAATKRQADFLIGRQRRADGRLAVFEMAHDIFDRDDRIVEDDADDERERQQRDRFEVETGTVA